MDGLDLTKLSVGDAVAALRSYPRRYRAELVTLAEDPEQAALLDRVGPDGHSALDQAADVARTIALLDKAVADVLVHDDAVLHPGVLDTASRVWDDQPMEVYAVLALLDDVATSLADRAQRASANAWYRTATVAGSGESIEAFDLLREAVRVGGDGLRAVQRTLAAVR